MKNIILLLSFLVPLSMYSQIATEDVIPFTLNTDMDGDINVIDNDDDNDGVLDNLDLFPLDVQTSTPNIIIDTTIATHDAGLRSNSNNTSNNNYGAHAIIQTKNSQRSFIVKVPIPADLDINSATFIFYSDSEDDPLAVTYLPDSDWDEVDITFNTTNFTGEQLLGLTNAPIGDEYSFTLPLNIIPAGGGDITLWIYDPLDPDGSTEGLYTKEYIGDTEQDQLGDKAARIVYSYNEAITPRIEVDQTAGNTEFINGGPFEIGYKLTQLPTNTVYLPIEISNGNADIIGAEVLEFDATNWNIFQTLQLDVVDPGKFDVHLRPLHSVDNYYNGNNPEDLTDYNVQSTDIINLNGWTVATGSTFDLDLMAISGVGSTSFLFEILDGPSGINVKEATGQITFSPLNFQIGSHTVKIKVTDEAHNISYFETLLIVTDGGVSDPEGYIVDLNADDDDEADGTGLHPFNDIADAIDYAVDESGGDILLRGGSYDLSSVIFISAAASESEPVTIKPIDGETVKINFGIRAAFQFTQTSKHITLENVEIDGGTDTVDFWCVVGQSVWGDASVKRGGGLCVIADGEDITIKDCYLHDAYQKGVEITGRYITVDGCIIRNIATTSISGGHGIMRQQQGREFFDADDLSKYRWDINSNMLFNIEQRIYSWVPSKGFMEMVIDEGKPILIDDPKDSNGVADVMKARITNNVVAFGSVDHIRLKSTPGLEVSNNSVFSETVLGDGITDKQGDTITAQFTKFIFTDNASRTNAGTTTALEIDTAIGQDIANGGSPIVSGNYAMGGKIKPDPYPGLTELDPNNGEMYIDPQNGNFRLNPSLSLPTSLGVAPLTLDTFDMDATKFGIEIKWDGWITDNLKLSQSILDNMPGVRDGIIGNDTVIIEGSCILNANREHLDCDVQANTFWKNKYSVGDTMQFRLNPLYTEWYLEVEAEYPGYERIRWGCSNLKQDQVLDPNWLLHSKITVDTNTVLYGPENSFTIDGDILVEFENHTPVIGDFYDLIIADSITSANSGDIFDQVLFKGYTPAIYSIDIVDIPEGQAVRLTIGNVCNLLVTNTSDSGEGSLRDAIACAMDGDVITLSAVLENDTIKLTSTPLVIDKSIEIVSERTAIYVQNCSSANTIQVAASRTVALDNFTILSDVFDNFGMLNCTDIIFKKKDSSGESNFNNMNGSSLTVNGEVMIK